jgi:hypothetical protein
MQRDDLFACPAWAGALISAALCLFSLLLVFIIYVAIEAIGTPLQLPGWPCTAPDQHPHGRQQYVVGRATAHYRHYRKPRRPGHKSSAHELPEFGQAGEQGAAVYLADRRHGLQQFALDLPRGEFLMRCSICFSTCSTCRRMKRSIALILC